MEEQRRVDVPLKVTPELLKAVPEHLIRERIQYLVALFKQEYEKLFPTDIDEIQFLRLAHLSYSLESLQKCAGFDLHISEFKNDVDSTRFVTTLPSYLRNRTQCLELEPKNPLNGKRADIKVLLEAGAELFVECKHPTKEIHSQLRTEQEPMYEVLKSHISRPCDVSVIYEESLKGSDLARLGQFIEERLPQVSGEGTILNHEGVKVDITNIRESFEDIGDIQLQMILNDYHANERNPINIINRNGVAISFIKRGISVLDNVEQQLKASRNKAPQETPMILAIRSDYLTGPLDENINGISAMFQPNKYTSFNGILLMRWSYNFQDLIEHEFQYINNPYARNPVTDLSGLFRHDSSSN